MNVFITIDYELFMGKISGSVEKCLITPMDNFTGMLDNYGIKLLFCRCRIFITYETIEK